MSEYETLTKLERDLKHMESPYREDTKLDRIFLFMQNGNWHTLGEVTENAWCTIDTTSEFVKSVGEDPYNRSRVASALRTIRSHPKLNVRYDCERGYCLELSTNPYLDTACYTR